MLQKATKVIEEVVRLLLFLFVQLLCRSTFFLTEKSERIYRLELLQD